MFIVRKIGQVNVKAN